MLRKIFLFVLCLLPWFVTSFLPIDYNYYQKLDLPFFAPPSSFYGIAWGIVYVLISLNISKLLSNYKFRDVSFSYKLTLIINYLFNQSYVIFAFILKNNFLGFIACLGTFISSLFLYEETSKYQSKKLLIPYILLGLFATILSLSIYFLNI